MKFIHMSDLHIGIKLKNYDLAEEQKYVFNQVVKYTKAYQPDAFVIAGDVYDKSVPSAEAISFFDDFICDLRDAAPEMDIMIISGNHDSAPRVNLYRSLLNRQHIHMIGNPPTEPDEYIERVSLRDEFGEVDFYLLPFVKPSVIKDIVGTDDKGNNLSYDASVRKLIERENIDVNKRNVLVSHQFYMPSGGGADDFESMDSEIHTAGNIDEVNGDILKLFDYAALGHIHKPWKLGDEFHRYCGTPYSYSVSEAGQHKAAVLVEINEKGNIHTKELPLEPLHSVRVIKGDYLDVINAPSEDYVKIILTDKADNNSVEMQERLRSQFPNYLEITREHERGVSYELQLDDIEELEPFDICRDFLRNDITDEELELLRDVFEVVK